jgi:outer membrane receptor protein involved in Fe transport
LCPLQKVAGCACEGEVDAEHEGAAQQPQAAPAGFSGARRARLARGSPTDRRCASPHARSACKREGRQDLHTPGFCPLRPKERSRHASPGSGLHHPATGFRAARIRRERRQHPPQRGANLGQVQRCKLSLQASVGGEYSKLSLLGAGGSERTFWRPKGFVSTAWKASPRLDLNAKLERKVGQLNFLDFLASENLSNDSRNSGNPDLVPPQSWELDLSGTRNLGAFGSTTLRLFGRLLEDVVDQVPIGLTGESPGNIDKASVYGMESKSTLLMDPLGWKGAKLDARFMLQTSRVKDPLTGEPRQISGTLRRSADLSLRHDVPGTDWAWGGGASHFRPAKNFRLGEVSLGYEGLVFANLFLEHKDLFGLTVRGTVGNLPGADQILDRTVNAGRRTNPVTFIERRRRAIGPIFGLSVSGAL